jgi:transposase
MRFVPIKSADQQALLMLHRTRDLLIRQRTQLINALRAHLAEFGLVAETGREGLTQLVAIITDESNREALPSTMKQALQAIIDQLVAVELQVGLGPSSSTPSISVSTSLTQLTSIPTAHRRKSSAVR